MNPATVEAVARALRDAESVLFITGAGMSAESGLPTYRGIGGLYEDALTDEGIPIEVALSGEMLHTNPALTWKHIARVERACRGATFNEGHATLAKLETRFSRACVLTQNVDGFHGVAGSKNVIEIHGNVHALTCTARDLRRHVASYEGLDLPPSCPECGALVRPEVVLFGETLPDAAVERLGRELALGFDAVVSIGTTSVFPYIAGPVVRAARDGKVTVEINPGDTEVSRVVTHRLRSGARDALSAIERMLRS